MTDNEAAKILGVNPASIVENRENNQAFADMKRVAWCLMEYQRTRGTVWIEEYGEEWFLNHLGEDLDWDKSLGPVSGWPVLDDECREKIDLAMQGKLSRHVDESF